jgi:hypothetical protein
MVGSSRPDAEIPPPTLVGLPAKKAYPYPPTARKNACARESWPVLPVSRFRPIAPMIAAMQNSPTCNSELGR